MNPKFKIAYLHTLIAHHHQSSSPGLLVDPTRIAAHVRSSWCSREPRIEQMWRRRGARIIIMALNVFRQS